MTKLFPVFLENILPPLQRFQRLVLEDGDIIIHAPGFEDRTMDITGAVLPNRSSRAVLFDYIPVDNANRLSDVRVALSNIGINVSNDNTLKYNRFAPGEFEMQLQTILQAQDINRVIIDISTMSKLLIILVLNVCKRIDLPVRILYCEAEKYGPSQEEFERAKRDNEIHRPTLQIYDGVHGVVRVDSLASVAMQGQPTAAIVFMSFNNVLTQVLLNSVYPSRLFLINGVPPVHKWREEATAWIHDQVRNEWSEDNPVKSTSSSGVSMPKRVASTLDYRGTVSLLLQLYWQLSANHRILLAPSGSKLQAVGSYIVKALHPDIHIEYPSPKGFFKNYSWGLGQRWLLDLGRLSVLLLALSGAEKKEYLEIQAPEN